MKPQHTCVALIAAACLGQAATAAVSEDEARQLGGPRLTAFGAEKGANKDGTIPPYSGKAPAAPANYDRKTPGQRPDPYNDKPLFTITAQNAAQYADKLDGMLEVFKAYPEFRMDVYPSRRDWVYPQQVLDNTVKNARSCEANKGEQKLEGCSGGFPFPIPKTGYEVMWNHLIQFQAPAYMVQVTGYLTPSNGVAVLQTRTEALQQYDYYDPGRTTPHAPDVVYWKVLQTNTAPARKVGEKVLILDSLDMVDIGRRVYQYIPGQRRVKLAPNLAYDTPSPNTGGASTMDDIKGFGGAMDRYDFKLVGKKEKFIMYNNFALNNAKTCADEKVVNNKNFPHPDCVRWELHRVWQVDAALKPGMRHIYAKRVFFWDEDAPGAGSSEGYDAAGKLYRILNQAAVPFYEHESGGVSDASYGLDLQTGAWYVQGSASVAGGGYYPVERKNERFFSPESLASDGIR